MPLSINGSSGITGAIEVQSTGSVLTGVTTVAAGSTSAPSISPTGDSNTGIFFPSADTVAIAEGGVEAVRVDSSGRVGINSNSPNDYQVDISSPTDRPALRVYRQRNTSGGGLLDIRSDVGGVNTREFLFSSGGDLTLSTGNLVFGTAGKGIDFSATANSSGTMTSELLDDYEEGTFTASFSGSTFTTTGYYTKVGRLVHIHVYGAGINVTSTTGAVVSGLPFTIRNQYSTGAANHNTYTTNGDNFYFTTDGTSMYFYQQNTITQANTNLGNPRYVMMSGCYTTDT